MSGGVRLDGRVALVTGAGRGIGRAEALALASAGAAVVVNDPGYGLFNAAKNEAVAGDVVAEIRAQGGRAVADYGDCSDWDEAAAMIERAVGTFGRLDIVLNNAGNLRERMSFNMDERDFDDVVAVHLKGHFQVARHAAAYFRRRAKAGGAEPAWILNTTSDSGLFGQGAIIGYTVSKAAIAGLTIALARELAAYDVRVNAVAPGAFRTRLLDMTGGDDDPVLAPRSGGWDRLDPANIGPTVVWLCSAHADFTGQVVWSSGDAVELYEGWRPVARLSADRLLQVDELVRLGPRLFDGRLKVPVDVPAQDEGHWAAAGGTSRGRVELRVDDVAGS